MPSKIQIFIESIGLCVVLIAFGWQAMELLFQAYHELRNPVTGEEIPIVCNMADCAKFEFCKVKTRQNGCIHYLKKHGGVEENAESVVIGRAKLPGR